MLSSGYRVELPRPPRHRLMPGLLRWIRAIARAGSFETHDTRQSHPSRRCLAALVHETESNLCNGRITRTPPSSISTGATSCSFFSP